MSRAERTFRALSDRTRLRILNLLRGGELCVGDLMDLLGVPQPTASRHLAYLRKTGLVTARRDGLWGFYSLSVPSSEFHRKLLSCLDACRDVEPEFDIDTRNATELRRAGGCCPGQTRGASSARGRTAARPSTART